MLNKHFKVVSVGLNQVLFSQPCRHWLGIVRVSYPLFKISYLCFIGYEISGLYSDTVQMYDNLSFKCSVCNLKIYFLFWKSAMGNQQNLLPFFLYTYLTSCLKKKKKVVNRYSILLYLIWSGTLEHSLKLNAGKILYTNLSISLPSLCENQAV